MSGEWEEIVGSDPYGRLSLSGHQMIVFGAASGIGRASSLLLAARGAQVVLADVGRAGLAETAGVIRQAGGVCVTALCDVTDDEAVESLMTPYDSETPLHAVINCVGITGRNGVPVDQIEGADFRQVVEINLAAAFTILKAAVPRLTKRRYGRILMVSSVAGKDGNPGMASYSASKAGLIGLVKSVAKDVAVHGVTVNALAPATIRTPMVDTLAPAQLALNLSKVPMQRLGRLSEAAEMIAWAVSPAASFTTGFTFDLSGGRATY